MAKEDDKKEEEKFELDSAGQALAYISLDQARVLAMEHARDNTGFYGRRYRRRELAWEVVSQEESEDYYDIRLSYRPARGFQGEPGEELFTIDKTGPIRIRQILSEPRPVRSPLLVPGAVASFIAIVGAVIGILFATGVFNGGETPVPRQPPSKMPESATAVAVMSTRGRIRVKCPAEITHAPGFS